MKIQIIKIGNSKGIRIPKSILDQSGIEKDVDIEVREGELIIRPHRRPRKNWGEAFKSMHENNDDSLLDINDEVVRNKWDDQEWEW